MDSAQKIANCIRASAADLSLEIPSVQAAKNIIGLGLLEAMKLLFPQESEQTHVQLVERYKYHFITGDKTEQGLFEGVIAGLESLDERGVLLAIATGKSRVGLDRVLKLVDLQSMFTVTRCADETRTKPHPQMLTEILDFTAIDPKKTLMIGDTTYDMEMASNAGVQGLGVGYGVHTPEDLYSANAVDVVETPARLFEWLHDGRLEVAFGS